MALKPLLSRAQKKSAWPRCHLAPGRAPRHRPHADFHKEAWQMFGRVLPDWGREQQGRSGAGPAACRGRLAANFVCV